MSIFATAGSALYIGAAIDDKDTDFILSDFAAQSWVNIGGLTNLGELGDTAELITANLIALARTKKAKGTRNAGSMAIVAAHDAQDEGQVLFRAAELVENNFAFKLVFNDAPVGGTPSERYFIALVMGARNQFNEANNVMNLLGALEINSNIVMVEATPPT
jgi:hypothetical protein